jgi:DNA gyrase subunit B
MSQQYGADQIQVLEGLDPVRKRPGMYIGSTDITGLHHLVWEVIDNSIDEAMAGHCDRIDIKVHKDGSLSVTDNGRGIPTDIHAKTGLSAVETVLTKLHAGGKFGGGGYKVSGGLHGVGVSCVNALSTDLHVEVHRKGKIHRQHFKIGVPQAPLSIVGDTDLTGTTIHFYPDATIFDTVKFISKTLLTRIRQQAFLTKGISLFFTDERVDLRKAFYFEGGIQSFVKQLNHGRTVIGEATPFYIEVETEHGMV